MVGLIAEWIDAEHRKELRDKDSDLGGTMRLGSQVCHLLPDSMAWKLYAADQIEERHRHRFEVNNNYLPTLKEAGLVVGGCLMIKLWWKPSNCRIIPGFCQPVPSEFNSPQGMGIRFSGLC